MPWFNSIQGIGGVPYSLVSESSIQSIGGVLLSYSHTATTPCLTTHCRSHIRSSSFYSHIVYTINYVSPTVMNSTITLFTQQRLWKRVLYYAIVVVGGTYHKGRVLSTQQRSRKRVLSRI